MVTASLTPIKIPANKGPKGLPKPPNMTDEEWFAYQRTGQEAGFGQHLKAVADAENIGAFGGRIRHSAHDRRLCCHRAGAEIVTIGKAAGKHHELRFFDLGDGGIGDGDDRGGKANELECAGGFGITVSYWESTQAIANWQAKTEHRIAQETGKTTWYADYQLRIAKVERAYGKPTS